MSSVSVPEEAASHLREILLAFNRDIFGSLLDEADQLAESGQETAAILIAGTLLEYLERSPGSDLVSPEHRAQIESWRELRNQAAHGSPGITREAAHSIIKGVRELVLAGNVGEEGNIDIVRLARSIKGKYADVRTSSDEFMARKRNELKLEDR
jgi:hypothetical protein